MLLIYSVRILKLKCGETVIIIHSTVTSGYLLSRSLSSDIERKLQLLYQRVICMFLSLIDVVFLRFSAGWSVIAPGRSFTVTFPQTSDLIQGKWSGDLTYVSQVHYHRPRTSPPVHRGGWLLDTCTCTFCLPLPLGSCVCVDFTSLFKILPLRYVLKNIFHFD